MIALSAWRCTYIWIFYKLHADWWIRALFEPTRPPFSPLVKLRKDNNPQNWCYSIFKMDIAPFVCLSKSPPEKSCWQLSWSINGTCLLFSSLLLFFHLYLPNNGKGEGFSNELPLSTSSAIWCCCRHCFVEMDGRSPLGERRKGWRSASSTYYIFACTSW